MLPFLRLRGAGQGMSGGIVRGNSQTDAEPSKTGQLLFQLRMLSHVLLSSLMGPDQPGLLRRRVDGLRGSLRRCLARSGYPQA